MLREFLRWWVRRMLELVPARASTGRAAALLAEPVGGDAVALTLRQRRARTPLGVFGLDPAGLAALRAALRPHRRRPPAVLLLPDGALLEREVALPLAAEPEAHRALRYEMDRVTPFTAEDVFWSWEVARRDRPHGRLHLRLWLVPKAALGRLLSALAGAGAPVAALEGRGPDGTPRAIPLRDAPPRVQARRRRVLLAACGVCAALALADVATPFVRVALARGRVEARIAALQPRVRQAESLRRRIAQEAAGSDAVSAARARTGDALGVLAALTQILPDDTFLTDLSLKQRRIALQGESANAARLIAALSADPAIRNPAFAAPVTRAGDDGRDRFEIRAEVAP